MADQARRLAEKKRKARFRAEMDKANKRQGANAGSCSDDGAVGGGDSKIQEPSSIVAAAS